jgi:hypothetical protein
LGQSTALSIKNVLSSGRSDQVWEILRLDDAIPIPHLSHGAMCVVLSAHTAIVLTSSVLVS